MENLKDFTSYNESNSSNVLLMYVEDAITNSGYSTERLQYYMHDIIKRWSSEIIDLILDSTNEEIFETEEYLLNYYKSIQRFGNSGLYSFYFWPHEILYPLMVKLASEGREDLFKHYADKAAHYQNADYKEDRAVGGVDRDHLYKALLPNKDSIMHLIEYMVNAGLRPGSVVASKIWTVPVDWSQAPSYNTLIRDHGYKDITADRAKKNNNLLLISPFDKKYAFYKDGKVRGFSVGGFGGDEERPFILKDTKQLVLNVNDAENLFQVFIQSLLNRTLRDMSSVIKTLPPAYKRRKPKKDDPTEKHIEFWTDVLNYLIEEDIDKLKEFKEFPFDLLPNEFSDDIKQLIKIGFIS